MTESQNKHDSTSGLSRRTVVKAAAWSVPIMAVGSNAPAMAASPTVPAPTISQFLPQALPVTQSNIGFQIDGSNFQTGPGGTTVTFSTPTGPVRPTTLDVVDQNTITGTVDGPALSTPETVVTVTTSGGFAEVTVPVVTTAPTISAFRPPGIPAVSNIGFQIDGSNFITGPGGTTVTFSTPTVPLLPTTLDVVDQNTITGTVDGTRLSPPSTVVTVTTSGGFAEVTVFTGP